VEFGPDTDYGHTATADVGADGPYRTLLLGSKPNARVHLRLVAEGPDGEIVGSDHEVETGPEPASLPNITVESDGSPHWGSYLLTTLAAQPTAVILDQDGDYVWWYTAAVDEALQSGPGEIGGKGTVMGRAVIARDGQSILYLYNNVDGVRDSYIYRVKLDGSELSQVSAPLSHHDLVELDDGTVAYLAYTPRNIDDTAVFGDSIVELSPDGSLRTVWDVWNSYDYEPPPGAAKVVDWPHANAIDYVPEEDAYFVSLLMLDSIVEIDRSTGTILRTIGGGTSDYVLPGDDPELFNTEHQFQWLDGNILVFVNGGMEAGSQSYAVEFALDDENGSAAVAWDYWPDPSLNCTNLGDVERLDSGSTLVTFSINGQIHEVDSSGQVTWKLVANVGGALGYVTRMEDLDVGAR
jgi:hypothetical protein